MLLFIGIAADELADDKISVRHAFTSPDKSTWTWVAITDVTLVVVTIGWLVLSLLWMSHRGVVMQGADSERASETVFVA